ncbi:MAG: hypothetical protein WEC75_06110 [Dehalococcoidia bacterium]
MPGQDLSLFGFLEEAEAMQYVDTYCILEDGTDRRQMWLDAQGRLGERIARAGKPEIRDIPKGYKNHLQRVTKTERFQDTVKSISWDFKLVEIDPLLAFQIHIEGARSEALGMALPADCGVNHLMPRCLPDRAERIEIHPTETDHSISLEAPTRNLLFLRGGYQPQADQDQFFVGAFIGSATPFVQVIRFGGRCYLTNGFHRLLSARRKGAMFAPCILGTTENFARTGAEQTGSLARTLLEGDNPPTVGHYTQGRATEIRLRRFATKITVTWDVSFPEIHD